MADSATSLALPGTAYAEANWGRWIAKCPNPHCANAMQLRRGQAVYECPKELGGCGDEAPIQWHIDAILIERILMARPVERTRNWLPHETIADLLQENLTHGHSPEQMMQAIAGPAYGAYGRPLQHAIGR
jgi:hypothetical protein